MGFVTAALWGEVANEEYSLFPHLQFLLSCLHRSLYLPQLSHHVATMVLDEILFCQLLKVIKKGLEDVKA